MEKFSGQCLCGKTRFSIEGVPAGMFCCHCSRCRKETGSVHGANLFLKDATLFWENGGENVVHFELSGTRKARAFCGICGSGLPRIEQETVVIPAGTLDKEITVVPTAHIHLASKAAWEDGLLTIPKFDELPS